MTVLGGVLIVLALMWTALNVVYSRNVGNYTELLRRGFVRVKVRYKDVNGVKVLRGWSYRVDLNSIMSNPVRSSSSFIKVYIKGTEAVAVAFATVEKFEVLEDNFFSIAFAKKAYL